jgi:hypothetical protein
MHDKGSSVPAWFGDFANKDKWDYDGVPADGPTNGFSRTVTTSKTDVTSYLQYGQNTTGWAGARFFKQQVVITSQSQNADGSITANGSVNIGIIAAYKTAYAATTGSPVIFTAKVNGVVVHSHTGNTIDEYVENPSVANVPFSVTLQPNTSSSTTSLILDWVYPEHQYPDAHFVIGTELYNPNLPTYVPFAIRDSNSWKALNLHNGHIKVRNGANGSWVDKSEEIATTSMQPNVGHNRVRNGANGTWLQAPAMKDS